MATGRYVRSVRCRSRAPFDHGLRRAEVSDRVRVSMYKLPGTVLGPEDAGDSEGHRGQVLTRSDLRSAAFHLDEVGKNSGGELDEFETVSKHVTTTAAVKRRSDRPARPGFALNAGPDW